MEAGVRPLTAKCFGLAIAVLTMSSACQGGSTSSIELGPFSAPEADQAVAVDQEHFYAIDNAEIGKYEKSTGKRVGGWKGEEGGPIIHLNSGIVIDGRLYCAHSNYPGIPMVGSIEIWDTETMEHVGSHSFGINAGSTTWIDFKDDHWYVAFVHYSKFAAQLGTDPRWSTLIKYDREWRPLESWVYPSQVLKRLDPYSNSGGAFGPDGLIYATGHDRPEIYVLDFPKAGSVLEYVETIEVNCEGQGIAWDPSDPWVLWVMRRSDSTIIPTRIEREE
jgi:hypothetical protein